MEEAFDRLTRLSFLHMLLMVLVVLRRPRVATAAARNATVSLLKGGRARRGGSLSQVQLLMNDGRGRGMIYGRDADADVCGQAPAVARKQAQAAELESNLAAICGSITAGSCGSNRVDIRASDFANGTYRITEPGCYVLVEDVEFLPNAFDSQGSLLPARLACDPQYPAQIQTYPPNAYGIGFFAALTIEADDVVLDLGGHEIKQSMMHYLMQRFFTNINLGTAPFITSHGPHDFGPFRAASRVCITNGRCGRSSHHCILGNNARDVVIKDLEVYDFEVAAVSLNRVSGLLVQDVKISNNLQDVPVIGTFSATRSIRPFVNRIANAEPGFAVQLRGSSVQASTIRDKLYDVLDAATTEVLANGRLSTPELVHEFGNPTGLAESTVYGINIHAKGPAVAGWLQQHPSASEASTSIYLKKVYIMNMTLSTREVVALEAPGQAGKPEVDAVGAVLRSVTLGGDGLPLALADDRSYAGNALSDAQLLVAQAASNGFDFSPYSARRSSISSRTLAWAASGSAALPEDAQMLCNGDDMFHVLKGILGVRLDGVDGAVLDSVLISELDNRSPPGSLLCNPGNSAYSRGLGFSHPDASRPGYRGGDSCGVGISSSRNVLLRRIACTDLQSSSGPVAGVHLSGETEDVDILQTGLARLSASERLPPGSDLGPAGAANCSAIQVDPKGALLHGPTPFSDSLDLMLGSKEA